MLSLVATMHVRRDQLKIAFPGDRDGLRVGCTCLIVEDLKIDSETSGSLPGHNVGVCCDAVFVTPGFKCLMQDEVPISVVRNDDILVA